MAGHLEFRAFSLSKQLALVRAEGTYLAPRSNQAFWEPKLARNKQRDGRAQLALDAAGWRVLVVWECELKWASRGATLAKLTADILQQEMAWEYLQAA